MQTLRIISTLSVIGLTLVASGPLAGQSLEDPAKNLMVNGFRFFGNDRLSNREIRELMGVPARDQFAKPIRISQKEIKSKLERVLDDYHDAGYLAASIDSIRWPDHADHPGRVEVYVSEGELFRVDRLMILGNKALSDQEIGQSMYVKPGSVFRSDELEADVREILDRYAGAGFLLVKIEIREAEVDFDSSMIDIALFIDEGKPIRLNEVAITGLDRTKPGVVVRELGLREGGIITRDMIDRIPDRIRRLSFLELQESPRATFLPDSTAIIALSLSENNSSQFNGVMGLNPSQGNQKAYLSGQIDLSFANLLGTGRSFKAFWHRRDRLSQTLRLGYEEPWLFNKPVNGLLGIEQIVQDTSFVRRTWYIGFKFYPFESLSFDVQAGRESVLPDSIGKENLGLAESRADNLQLGIRLDSRNHPWNPTSGILYQTSVEFVRKRIEESGTSQSQRTNFERINLDLEYYQPLFRRQILMFGLSGRHISLSDRVITVDELFRLGGSADLRGYREDQFLGSQIAWGTLEYRILLDRTSRLAFFVDAAYIGRRVSPDQLTSFYRTGYGLGIRTQTDIGILGFDFALGRGDSFSQGKVHIRLINTF